MTSAKINSPLLQDITFVLADNPINAKLICRHLGAECAKLGDYLSMHAVPSSKAHRTKANSKPITLYVDDCSPDDSLRVILNRLTEQYRLPENASFLAKQVWFVVDKKAHPLRNISGQIPPIDLTKLS